MAMSHREAIEMYSFGSLNATLVLCGRLCELLYTNKIHLAIRVYVTVPNLVILTYLFFVRARVQRFEMTLFAIQDYIARLM